MKPKYLKLYLAFFINIILTNAVRSQENLPIDVHPGSVICSATDVVFTIDTGELGNAPITTEYYWYTSKTSTSHVATGTSYTINNISGSTTMYAKAIDILTNSIIAEGQASVIVEGIAAAPSVSGGSIDGPGIVRLSVNNPSGTYSWYTSSGQAVSIYDGTVGPSGHYFDANVSQTTTFYVIQHSSSGCGDSQKAYVTATVNDPKPATPSAEGDSRCGTGDLTLNVINPTGEYRWYEGSTEIVSGSNASISNNGATLTLKGLEVTKQFNVRRFDNNLLSDPAYVWAIVNPVPSIPLLSVSTSTFAVGDEVTVSAQPTNNETVDEIRWYENYKTTYTTGISKEVTVSLIAPKTYAVSTVIGDCESVLQYITIPSEEFPVTIRQENLIRTKTYRKPLQAPSSIHGEVLMQNQYFDGIGRLEETVAQQYSTSSKDVVTIHDYDDLGRERKKWLPYPSSNENGEYQEIDLLKDELTDWYAQNKTDGYPFAESRIEDSPIGRVLEQGAPGQSWQLGENTIDFDFQFNQADEVILFNWEVFFETSKIYYDENQLNKSTVIDENDNQTTSYTNKSGNVVLKEVFLSETESAKTYYVYDDYNRLRVVLPPEANNRLDDEFFGKAEDERIAFLNSWAFVYDYDRRGRMIQKKVPGADAVLMIYDNWNRLVLTQDGNQRFNNKNEWTFTKYDYLNRPVITGIMDMGDQAIEDIQNVIDGMTTRFEVEGNDLFGYTNDAYPPNAEELEVLSVIYYDHYDFPHAAPMPYVPYAGYGETLNSVKGQVTGTKTRILNSSEFLDHVTYYDDRYRIIQTQTENTKGGIDIVHNTYDFTGQLIKSRTSHYVIRPLAWTDMVGIETVGGNNLRKTVNSGWGNGGAASYNRLAAGGDGWVSMEIKEFGASLMLGLSEENIDADYDKIDYGLYVRDNGSVYIYENGVRPPIDREGRGSGPYPAVNIGDVLKIERVDGVIYYKHNDQVLYESWESSTGSLLVDISMYEEGATMHNIQTSFAGQKARVVDRRLAYDHAGRLLQTHHWLAESPDWEVVNGLEVDANNDLLQTGGGSTYHEANAYSKQVIKLEDDGYFEVTPEERIRILIGLNDDPTYTSYSDMDYAMFIHITGEVYVYENGKNMVLDSTVIYYPGDVMRVAKIDGSVHYQRNGITFYTSSKPVATNLTPDLTSINLGTLITNAIVSTREEVLLSENDYNELGELVDKKLYVNEGGVYEQSLDYQYNIRGWLTAINDANLANEDLFGFELKYDDPEANGGAAQFNGNISEIVWQSFGGDKQSYGYEYDEFNRLIEADYYNSDNSIQNGLYNVSIVGTNGESGYDLNGNILSLKRGLSSAYQDDLAYSYDGNQLIEVSDGGAEEGFKDGNTGEDYLYDANGNMIQDLNKGITNIEYNYLNLPYKVHITNEEGEGLIEYTYDAAGVKLSQRVYKENMLEKQTDYVGEFIYENDTLQLIQHEEGRIVPVTLSDSEGPESEEGVSYDYQYHLKDHLGNVRLTFSTTPENYTMIEGFEGDPTESYFQDWHQHTNLNANTTEGGDKVALLQSGETGALIMLQVNYGDTVNLKVNANYENAPTGNNFLSTAFSALFGAYNSSIAGGEASAAIENEFSEALSGTGMVDKDKDNEAPRAFLNYILFDEFMQYIAAGFQQISTAAEGMGVHEQISIDEIIAEQKGYVLAYLSNENAEAVNIHFDDFTIYHGKTKVVQKDDYYPFGLAFNSFKRPLQAENSFLYTGKESIDDLNLGWIDFGARMYMPDIGRWGVIDPLTIVSPDLTPYRYGFNNPVRFFDPDGMYEGEAGSWEKGDEGFDDVLSYWVVGTTDPQDGDVNDDGQVYNGESKNWTSLDEYMGWGSRTGKSKASLVGMDIMGNYKKPIYDNPYNGILDGNPDDFGSYLAYDLLYLWDLFNHEFGFQLDMTPTPFATTYRMRSLVKRVPSLLKIAKKLPRETSRNLNFLFEQLRQGNFGAGRGVRHLFGDVWEMRSREAARLYYRKQDDVIEILGYSGKGTNQDQVISILKKEYGK